MQTSWHLRHTDQILHELDTTLATGLSEDQAGARRTRTGANELQAGGRHSPLRPLATQFSNTMVLILMAAARRSLRPPAWPPS